MTNDQLEAIRKRAEAATPGPWEVWTGCSWRRIGSSRTAREVILPTNHPSDNHPDLSMREEDGEFVAHAREDIPALLAEVERLRGEIETLGFKFIAAISSAWPDGGNWSGVKIINGDECCTGEDFASEVKRRLNLAILQAWGTAVFPHLGQVFGLIKSGPLTDAQRAHGEKLIEELGLRSDDFRESRETRRSGDEEKEVSEDV